MKRRSVLIIMAAIVMFSSYGHTATVKQLSDNFFFGNGPDINDNGQAVWGGNDTGAYDIHRYDKSNGQTVNISADSMQDRDPKINNNGHIVWVKETGNTGERAEIFYYNGSSVRLISSNTWDDINPRINNNNKIVWQGHDGNDFEIFYWNGSAIQQLTKNSTDDTLPEINDSSHIVWQGFAGSDTEIFYWNGSGISQLTNNSIDDRQPSINNNGQMAWHDYNGDVYLRNGPTTSKINTTASRGDHARISNNGWVVWEGRDFQTYLYQGGTAQIISYREQSSKPQINDNGHVVYASFYTVFLWTSGSTDEISMYGNDFNAQLNNNREIVWSQGRNIYMYASFDEDGDGYADNDCDDSDPSINPGALETCDGIDNNCNGTVDEGFDTDNDGYRTCDGDCNDGDASVSPGAEEICDGIDNNCDGTVDEGFTDLDQDGFSACMGDCDDNNPLVNPGAQEIWYDGADQNCDGSNDYDADSDGYVGTGYEANAGGTAPLTGDCADQVAAIFPSAAEVCDELDNNCDGIIDEGFDAGCLDGDGDGISEDGDNSGVSGDNPCTGGNTLNCDDNCPAVANPGQANSDADTFGDACDNCRMIANQDQLNDDNDQFGNVCDLDYNQKAYYPFHGNANDESGNNNHGTVEDADLAFDRAGNLNEAYSFNGFSGGIAAQPLQITTNQITVASWIYLNGDPTNGDVIAGMRENSRRNWTLEVFEPGYQSATGNNIAFRDSDGNQSFDCVAEGGNLAVGTWYHVAATDNAGLINIYINGNPVKSCINGLGIYNPIQANLSIGYRSSNNSKNFNGLIDDVVIYDRVLSQEDIAYLYSPCSDADGDGYSVEGGSCGAVDCDDSNADIFPGNTEVCDGLDNDCDAQVDEGAAWSDLGTSCSAGTGACEANGVRICDANNSAGATVCSVLPGPPEIEICDGIDNDCDAQIDEGAAWAGKGDACSVGAGECSRDGVLICNADPTLPVICSVSPGSPVAEVCDGLDNDCDGIADDGLSVDADSDGYTSPGSCLGTTDDCDDSNADIFPGAPEICTDQADNDCDGLTDGQDGECFSISYYCDNDNDGYISLNLSGSCPVEGCIPAGCSSVPGSDCDDSTSETNPGAPELCLNPLDNDCDGIPGFFDPQCSS
ncbi:hypothetical protein H8E50_06650, partial [bacterium]|nr:hypothetical protein [bacterium]